MAQVEPLPFVPATWMKLSFFLRMARERGEFERVFQPELCAEQTQTVKKLDGFGVGHAG